MWEWVHIKLSRVREVKVPMLRSSLTRPLLECNVVRQNFITFLHRHLFYFMISKTQTWKTHNFSSGCQYCNISNLACFCPPSALNFQKTWAQQSKLLVHAITSYLNYECGLSVSFIAGVGLSRFEDLSEFWQAIDTDKYFGTIRILYGDTFNVQRTFCTDLLVVELLVK